MSPEPQQWCGALPWHLFDRAHHAGHGADRHCGGEHASLTLTHMPSPLFFFNKSVIIRGFLSNLLQGGLINFEKRRRVGVAPLWWLSRLTPVLPKRIYFCSVLFFFISYNNYPIRFLSASCRSLRSCLRFGSCRLPVPTTASQSTTRSLPGCRHTRCSLTRRGETTPKHM